MSDAMLDRQFSELLLQRLRERMIEIARGLPAATIAKLRAGLPIEQAAQAAAEEAVFHVDQAEAEALLAIEEAVKATRARRPQ
jgi:hypothetical protein